MSWVANSPTVFEPQFSGGSGSPVACSLHFESLERDPEVGAGFITVQKRPTGPSSALLIPTTLSTRASPQKTFPFQMATVFIR